AGQGARVAVRDGGRRDPQLWYRPRAVLEPAKRLPDLRKLARDGDATRSGADLLLLLLAVAGAGGIQGRADCRRLLGARPHAPGAARDAETGHGSAPARARTGRRRGGALPERREYLSD